VKIMKIKWIVWNVDRACPVGAGFTRLRDALANALVAEVNSGEHYTVVPA
jgi:hypothetical protein